jgi:hypothetical protein
MNFGDIDSTVFGFGQSQDDDRPEICELDKHGKFEFKVCKATKGTGGGGRVDASEQNVDKIRIRSKQWNLKGTCKSFSDHIISQCVCTSVDKKKQHGAAVNMGKCDDKGWQEYIFRKTEPGGITDMYGWSYKIWTCDKEGKYEGPKIEKQCKGCKAKEYDKEFDLTSVFNNAMTDDYRDLVDGNPVLVNFRGPDWIDFCQDSYTWWCSSQSRLLFDYAAKKCGGLVSVSPDVSNEKYIGLTPEVQDCLLETLACDHPRDDIKAAIMSMFTDFLSTEWGTKYTEEGPHEPMFPLVDCRTGACREQVAGNATSCGDDKDTNFKCK